MRWSSFQACYIDLVCWTAFGREPTSDIGSSRVRLSLWQENANALGSQDNSKDKYGLSQTGQWFLGGVFHHLPAILAFTAPLPIRWRHCSILLVGFIYSNILTLLF